MANDKPEVSTIVAAFVNTLDDQDYFVQYRQISRLLLKKNLNASRPSEHLFSYRGKKVPRW